MESDDKRRGKNRMKERSMIFNAQMVRATGLSEDAGAADNQTKVQIGSPPRGGHCWAHVGFQGL